MSQDLSFHCKREFAKEALRLRERGIVDRDDLGKRDASQHVIRGLLREACCWPATKRGWPWSGEGASQRDAGVARQVNLKDRATSHCAPSAR
jgi:hypothetical protein